VELRRRKIMSTGKLYSFFTHNAWKVIFGFFILILFLGIGEFIQGQGGDPGMVEAISGISWKELQASYPGIARLLDVETMIIGSLWVGLGLTGAALSLNGLKDGKRWSWWASWSLPLVMALIIGAFLSAGLIPNSPTPPALISAPITIIVSAIALMSANRGSLAGG
jgi:hypothetical protein